MTEQEKEIVLLVTGEDGLIMKMRLENEFDNQKFDRVMEILKSYFMNFPKRVEVSTKIACSSILLADALAGGSRFFQDETVELVEDASSELTLFFETIMADCGGNGC